jgi:hypothetical protein
LKKYFKLSIKIEFVFISYKAYRYLHYEIVIMQVSQLLVEKTKQLQYKRKKKFGFCIYDFLIQTHSDI